MDERNHANAIRFVDILKAQFKRVGSILGTGLFGSYPKAPGNGFGSPGFFNKLM